MWQKKQCESVGSKLLKEELVNNIGENVAEIFSEAHNEDFNVDETELSRCVLAWAPGLLCRALYWLAWVFSCRPSLHLLFVFSSKFPLFHRPIRPLQRLPIP